MPQTHGQALRRALTTAATVLAVTAPAAHATPATDAATWLTGQLSGSPTPDHLESFGVPDVGGTIDANAAFAAVGAGYATQRANTYAFIASQTETYSGGGTCGGAGNLYAGAVAKLASAAIVNGSSPMSVGPRGRNLIADLECLQTAAGRFVDQATSDSSNTATQSLAIRVLASADPTYRNANGSTLATAARYLVASQCTNTPQRGAFRVELGGSPSACNGLPPYDPARSPPVNLDATDVEATSLAVRGLWAEGSTASRAAAAQAGIWLVGQVQSSSPPARQWWRSWCGVGSVPFPSATATSLATGAYVTLGLSATAARGWLADAIAAGPDNGVPTCNSSGIGDPRTTALAIAAIA
jgi:hypothetical protein